MIEKSVVEDGSSSSSQTDEDLHQEHEININLPTITIPSTTPKNGAHQNTITPTGASSVQDMMDLHQSLCNYFKGTPMNANYIQLVLDLVMETQSPKPQYDPNVINEERGEINIQLKELQKKLWMFIQCTKMMQQDWEDN